MSSLITDNEVTEHIECVNVMDRLTQAVVDYIDQHTESEAPEPFFIYYPMNSPHAPVVPAEEWKEKGGIPGAYPAFVAQTDNAVGQVLASLEKNHLNEDTIVIFGTDNGCHQDPKRYLDQGHSVSGPLRDKKASIYDGGHRIPFIIRWPGIVAAGTKSAQLICMSDLFASFAEFFSFEVQDDMAEDSISFLPLLLGEHSRELRENIVHHDFAGRFAIRERSWKLILRRDDEVQNPEGLEKDYQLYNLAEDIAESNNLANEHPDKVKTLLALLEQQVADGRSTPGDLQKNDTTVDVFKKKVKTKSAKSSVR